ncbi:MAG: dihydropteroate synthase [Methanobacteriota archaeon]
MDKIIYSGKFKLDLDKTLVMGILNVTPDSFFDGGSWVDVDAAVERGREMVELGADIIDVGGESTRPGSDMVPIKEELKRVLPVVEALACELRVPISIDSYKPEVVEKAISAGASMVNDVYGLRSVGMAELVAESGLPVVVMHMQGSPKNMQENPSYNDVVMDIKSFFKERIMHAKSHGVLEKQIILDPGIGFGKTLDHNLEILRRLPEFRDLGLPLLIGASRKSMIGEILNAPPCDRLSGSLAIAVIAAAKGANILRVHDIGETVAVLKVADTILKN